eukprot:CAMPEP_0177619744 /NCGR_PEP_ID=MMETSP0419_2-20121207/26462_1 /TAXON_ID=582737 /ORGANISM="Tetraselmis sp., Strain GSL018" /LENGTH=348 /DNA_ID=CAMNT_0019119109 /DNA_START=84 /DNA_END=1133 /DNA_ORIENTATION=-
MSQQDEIPRETIWPPLIWPPLICPIRSPSAVVFRLLSNLLRADQVLRILDRAAALEQVGEASDRKPRDTDGGNRSGMSGGGPGRAYRRDELHAELLVRQGSLASLLLERLAEAQQAGEDLRPLLAAPPEAKLKEGKQQSLLLLGRRREHEVVDEALDGHRAEEEPSEGHRLRGELLVVEEDIVRIVDEVVLLLLVLGSRVLPGGGGAGNGSSFPSASADTGAAGFGACALRSSRCRRTATHRRRATMRSGPRTVAACRSSAMEDFLKSLYLPEEKDRRMPWMAALLAEATARSAALVALLAACAIHVPHRPSRDGRGALCEVPSKSDAADSLGSSSSAVALLVVLSKA